MADQDDGIEVSNPDLGAPTGSGVSARLWQEEYEFVVENALNNPFVLALAHGTLSRQSFAQYIAQDAHFLEFFSKSYELARGRCADTASDVYRELTKLLEGVQSELKLHGAYAESLGVTTEMIEKPNASTRAYTSFLMRIAKSSADIPHVLAAMAPCSRLYGFLGCQLAAVFPSKDHPYARWLDTYSSEQYLAGPATQERLLDSLTDDIDAKTEAELRELYQEAMRLEVAFFSAQSL